MGHRGDLAGRWRLFGGVTLVIGVRFPSFHSDRNLRWGGSEAFVFRAASNLVLERVRTRARFIRDSGCRRINLPLGAAYILTLSLRRLDERSEK